MPRVCDGNSDPHDFCSRHFPPTEAAAQAKYGAGEGPDDRGNCFAYDPEHPPYRMKTTNAQFAKYFLRLLMIKLFCCQKITLQKTKMS